MDSEPSDSSLRPPHPAALSAERLLAECDLRLQRRGGPGGQHRNKVETAVVLTHRPTGCLAEANERRSQEQNRRAALFRLRLRLALAVRSSVAADDAPSPLWQSRCRNGRLAVNAEHDDFPALLAEALDRLAAVDHDLPAAAAALDCSNSQLVQLLKKEPAALRRLNELRQAQGQRPLR